MPRTRSWSDDALRQAVVDSSYMAEVLKKIGLAVANGNYKPVRKRIRELGLDTSHWLDRRTMGQKSGRLATIYAMSEILVEHSGYLNGSSLKRRLLADGLLKNECALCGQGPEWKGKSLVMVLDHINGAHDDNRVDNLRMLCPNCNSQQSTFAGRNKKTEDDLRKVCKCGKTKTAYSERCEECYTRDGVRRKVKQRPPIDILKKQVEEFGCAATGRMYGVSDNAVRKWMR